MTPKTLPLLALLASAQEAVINDDFRSSFHAFRDENHDGHDDDGSDDD
jgi:hypothetical protein